MATDLYMLTDTSPGFQDTWEALERRLADVHAAGPPPSCPPGHHGISSSLETENLARRGWRCFGGYDVVLQWQGGLWVDIEGERRTSVQASTCS